MRPAELRDRIVSRHRSGEGSIMLKWKKFGTTRRWPRTWWSLWLRFRDLVWRWDKLPEGQPSLRHSTEWPDGSLSSVIVPEGPLGVCKRALKGHSDCKKQHSLVWSNQDWTVELKHGGGSLMLLGWGKTEQSKRDILNENLVWSTQDLRLTDSISVSALSLTCIEWRLTWGEKNLTNLAGCNITKCEKSEEVWILSECTAHALCRSTLHIC